MAWWNKPTETSPTPVTIQRMSTTMDEMGYTADQLDDGRGLAAGFNGVRFLFLLEADGDFVEVSAGWLSEVPESELPKAIDACNEWNRSGPFPRMHATVGEDGINFYGETYVWAGNGLDDDQLKAAMIQGITAGVQAITDIREKFGDPIPAEFQVGD